MAIPSTTTAATLYVTREPAWEHGVELTQSLVTSLFTSRAGLEQRQQLRDLSHWTMRYTTYDAKTTERARWERTQAELAAPLVVPFWPEGAFLISLVGDTATITRTATGTLSGDIAFL